MPDNPAVIPALAADQEEMTAWRRDIHAHPELGFEEHRTSALVAGKLRSWGLEVTTGVGRTGVVGTLRVGNSTRTIGLRADMDALPIPEANGLLADGLFEKFPCESVFGMHNRPGLAVGKFSTPGVMHITPAVTTVMVAHNHCCSERHATLPGPGNRVRGLRALHLPAGRRGRTSRS